MFVGRIEAAGFLPFGKPVTLDLGPGVTVVTGPNGAGKSSPGRCLELARAVIGRVADDPAAGRLDLYKEAGYEGAGSFAVRLGLRLDQAWERRLVWAFVCAGYACGHYSTGSPVTGQFDAWVRDWLAEDSLAPLWSGSLVVRYDSGISQPWFAAWEFGHADHIWHVVLTGNGQWQLRGGSADQSAQPSGSMNLTDWLLKSKPADQELLDFGVALEMTAQEAAQKATAQPVTFAVQSQPGGPAAIPESLRELAADLGVADYSNRSFGFDHVMSVLLQRGVVLTDNGRLPLARWFSVEELAGPVDLRDGSGVAAELFRLKVGRTVRLRDRFEEIRATFRGLTGRDLDLRAWPEASEAGEPGMIIEPLVVDARGQRQVEFSGAGVQEALVLSALLEAEPGRFLLLDEPALNLEATVQRRLISGLPAAGQYLVITHSAELVPFEEPEDLRRIVRLAPGRSGAEVHRPALGNLTADQSLRWLRLLEPADVRALLFAAGVILCEGTTDSGALRRWWRRGAAKVSLPTPGDVNIPIISVDGHSHYGPYLRLLDGFRIPWAVVTDGPALRRSSQLAKDLDGLGRLPGMLPADENDFAQSRGACASAGVFTLADQFGDDGGKGGEFEAFLGRVDQTLLDRVRAELGSRSKPRVGAYFAAEHPEPPPEVLDLYERIADRLGDVVLPRRN